MTTQMTWGKTASARYALAVLFLFGGFVGCGNWMPQDTTLVEYGIKDPAPPPVPPPPPIIVVDIVVDASSPGGARANTDELIALAVDYVFRNGAGSQIRLWCLSSSSAELLVTVSVPPGQSTESAPEAPRLPQATLMQQHLLAELAKAKRTSVSPLGEALTKVALAAPADRSHWVIVVATDGIQNRKACSENYYVNPALCRLQFSCRPPVSKEWLKSLDEERLLAPGSLRGAAVVFAYFEPVATGGACCGHRPSLASMAFTQTVRDLWTTALVERAGATLTFTMRAPTWPRFAVVDPRSAMTITQNADKEPK